MIMRRAFFLLFCVLSMQLSAQRISRSYNNVPMSAVLKQMSSEQSKYVINFIYDELEDFRVTAIVRNQPLPDAIQQLIGFYPIKMTSVGDNVLLVECMQKEQRKIIGKIVDAKGQPMSYVNVSLLNASDSSFVNGGVSTEAGYFAIPCAEKNVVIKLSYVGYKTVTRNINKDNVGTITMYPDSYTLKGIVVKGHNKIDHTDHSVFTFTSEQIRNSRQSQELLATLPGLRIDPLTNKVSTFSGKSLKILVNGVEVTDNDLKSVLPEKIKNVEYYTVPPARYAGVGILLNIRTRKQETGYALGFDTQQGMISGFNNTNIYAKYTKGNSQFSVDYSLEYRNVAKCKDENVYKMADNGKTATYTYNGDYHFGYADNNLNIKYLYAIEDSIIFQIRFTPNLLTRFWRGDYDIKAEGNEQWKSGYSKQNRTTNSLGPSLNFYYSRKLNNKQQIAADVVGTFYRNKQGNSNNQFDENNVELLNDNMSQHNNKYSIIGEVAYAKDWDKMRLEAGYKATLSKSDFHISNVLSNYDEYKYNAVNDNHYAYVQLGGSIKKLVYRFSLGGTFVHTSNDDTRYDKLYFTPKMLLTYPVKNGQLSFQLWSEPVLPSISQLSSNSTIEIPGLINRGNPQLKSGNDNAVKLGYEYNNPYVYLNVSFVAEFISNPISNYYVWQNIDGKRTVVSTPMNADYENMIGGSYFVKIKPFKNEVLSISLDGGGFGQKQTSDIIGTHSHSAFPFAVSVESRWKNVGAYFFWRKVHYTLYGSYLSSNENTSNAGVYYQHKQLRLSANCMFPFRAPEYYRETLSNSILYFHRVNWLPSQRSLITLGVSYNIFSGKQKNINKQIENRDYDKGTF